MDLIKQRIINAAKQILDKEGYVSPIEVMIAIGWLQPAHVKDWRQGKLPFLEKVIQVNFHKLTMAMKHLKQWALFSGLKPSQTVYMSHGRKSKIKLRFSKSGNPKIEQEYSTHYISVRHEVANKSCYHLCKEIGNHLYSQVNLRA